MERRLYKSRKEKMIAGVAGGLAEYFDVDPVLLRIGFVVLAFLHGVGVLAYIILCIVVPKEKDVPVAVGTAGATDAFDVRTRDPLTMGSSGALPSDRGNRAGLVAGAVLIALGVLFLLDNLIPAFDFGALWPLVLIVLGGGLLWNSIKRDS